MARDNRDRYGYRHRRDPAYKVGESMPGDVGDSSESFQNRAQRNENVIVEGSVRSMESYQRSSVEAQKSESRSVNNSQSSNETISQTEAAGKVVTVSINSIGGTRDTIAEYKNHQVHVEGGKPGETIRVRLKKGPGFLVGTRVSVRE